MTDFPAPKGVPSARRCRTADEAFQAGWDDGDRLDEHIPPHLIDRLVALHRPYLLPVAQAAEPAA